MSTAKFYLPPYLKVLAVLLLIIVLVYILIIGKPLLVPIFMGGFFAILLTPFSNWMEKGKVPRVVSCLVALLTMAAIVVGLVTFVVVTVSNFTNDFDSDVSERLTSYAESLDQWTFNNLGVDEGLRNKANVDYLKSILDENSSSVSNFALRTVGSMSGIILIPVFMFFFLLYRDHLTRVIVELYRKKDPALVKMRILSLRKLIQNYIVGVVKVMGILAVLNVTAFSIIGIKHAIFFGVIAAILNIIPYVGPFVGVLMPIIFAFLTKDSLFYPLAIFATYQVIQLIESNFLTPKIVGGNVNLNAFVTFLGLLVGGSIWGVAGMILIIPGMAIMREIFELNEETYPFSILFGEEISEQTGEIKTEDAED
ncbi:AI-2E family transporter [Algoriphagus namhaensis]